MSREVDASRLPSDWAAALMRHGFDGDAVDQLVTEIYGSGPAAFPPKEQVFRAFHLTPLNDVRVVVLGQDPYPREGQANGLAFSFDGENLPRSLRAIYANLEADKAVDFHRPSDGDLTAWAQQGVLLLNPTLTVAEGKAGSPLHRKHWKKFTDAVLRAVAERGGHVVFLLWGWPAIRKAKAMPIDELRHLLIRSAHPAAWAAKELHLFETGRPFSEANKFLATSGATVDWNLGGAS